MTTKQESFHYLRQDDYDKLVALFGEQVASEDPRVRWVDIGAGSVTVTFFAPWPVADPLTVEQIQEAVQT